MKQAFRVQHQVTGAMAEIYWPPLDCRGDPPLCAHLREAMARPSFAFTQSYLDGERGTKVAPLHPGTAAWFLTQLRQAAAELDLQLEPMPLRPPS